jgi:hypothetical protein
LGLTRSRRTSSAAAGDSLGIGSARFVRIRNAARSISTPTEFEPVRGGAAFAHVGDDHADDQRDTHSCRLTKDETGRESDAVQARVLGSEHDYYAWEDPLASEPPGVYKHSDGWPIMGRKLQGKSQREAVRQALASRPEELTNARRKADFDAPPSSANFTPAG